MILFEWQPKWQNEPDNFAARWQDSDGAAFMGVEHGHNAPHNLTEQDGQTLSDTDIAWADGFAAGQHAAQTENDANQALAHAISALAHAPNALVEDALCRIIHHALTNILNMTPVSEKEVRSYVREACSALPQNPDVAMVLLHPDDAAYLTSESMPSGYEICTDINIVRGTVRICYEQGAVEYGRARRLEAISENLVPPC